MKALLLAAGLGTRLKPLTETVPKCLVPIRDRPLLDIWLEQLKEASIGPVLVNTHHLAGAVEAYVRNSAYRDQVTLVHETALLGTGGTLLANRAFYEREPVFFAHADNLCVCDLHAFARAHANRPEGTVMTMMTFVTDTPQRCGIVELDARNVVTRFHEKVAHPPGNLANGAVYIVGPEVLDEMETLGTRTLDFSTEVVPRFMGRIYTWHNAGTHRDIGTHDSWQAAQAVHF